MTDNRAALVEKVARARVDRAQRRAVESGHDIMLLVSDFDREDAAADIALIRAEVLEEAAAKVAEYRCGASEWSAETNSGYECAAREIAADIRKLKEK